MPKTWVTPCATRVSTKASLADMRVIARSGAALAVAHRGTENADGHRLRDGRAT